MNTPEKNSIYISVASTTGVVNTVANLSKLVVRFKICGNKLMEVYGNFYIL